MDLGSNPNTHWMSIFVEELAANGLAAVCIAPGSRSTPLALAFAAQPDVTIYRHLDERSAGFFALGLAKATRRPVALVCTSGTAAANFHPAIIEAFYSYVPLLVLTADRPAELRGSGANQTIDQIKMYGDHVRWSVEVPTPQDDAPEVVLRHLRTLAARAYTTADGLTRGPVHLNFPFRKPLEPGEVSTDGRGTPQPIPTVDQARSFTHIQRGRMIAGTSQIASVAETIKGNPRGLIICGPECPSGDFPAAVRALAHRGGYPLLADSLSNIRHGDAQHGEVVLGGYNFSLPVAGDGLGKPDVILRFGAVSTSAALAAYLEGAAPAHHIHVREDGEWADDLHITHEIIQADPAAFCAALAAALECDGQQPESEWMKGWRAAERKGWERLDAAMREVPFFDGSALRQVLSALPDGTALFAGNSMPVRHIDTFDQPDARNIAIVGNRGASGIDGNVSTALGLAVSGQYAHVVAVLGDITFYHDMNGLLALRQSALRNVTFVVINNDGGGIFHRLPIARHDPPFTDLFLTPHGLKFEHAAAMYGLAYRAVVDEAELADALGAALGGEGGPMLIEVETNSAADYRHMRAVAAAVATGVKEVATPAGHSASGDTLQSIRSDRA